MVESPSPSLALLPNPQMTSQSDQVMILPPLSPTQDPLSTPPPAPRPSPAPLPGSPPQLLPSRLRTCYSGSSVSLSASTLGEEREKESGMDKFDDFILGASCLGGQDTDSGFDEMMDMDGDVEKRRESSEEPTETPGLFSFASSLFHPSSSSSASSSTSSLSLPFAPLNRDRTGRGPRRSLQSQQRRETHSSSTGSNRRSDLPLPFPSREPSSARYNSRTIPTRRQRASAPPSSTANTSSTSTVGTVRRMGTIDEASNRDDDTLADDETDSPIRVDLSPRSRGPITAGESLGAGLGSPVQIQRPRSAQQGARLRRRRSQLENARPQPRRSASPTPNIRETSPQRPFRVPVLGLVPPPAPRRAGRTSGEFRQPTKEVLKASNALRAAMFG